MLFLLFQFIIKRCFVLQKDHFKSDWHRFNLKQELKGEKSINEEEFEMMTGDLSSISGSDNTTTSSEEDSDSESGPTQTVKSRLPKAAKKMESSDSDTDDEFSVMAATRKHPKIFLRNASGQLISLYRCILYHKKVGLNLQNLCIYYS